MVGGAAAARRSGARRGARRRAAPPGCLPPTSHPRRAGCCSCSRARTGARRILELGTLAGYSTIWLARALPPGGRLVTLERDPAHAAVARGNLERAGLADRVELRVGPALETLPRLAGEPFDLAFLDADKASTDLYLEHALGLLRPGGLIVADNVVRGGAVADPGPGDPSTEGIRALRRPPAAEPRAGRDRDPDRGVQGPRRLRAGAGHRLKV